MIGCIFRWQVDLLHRLSAHPNIAGLYELYEDAGNKYIVMVSPSLRIICAIPRILVRCLLHICFP